MALKNIKVKEARLYIENLLGIKPNNEKDEERNPVLSASTVRLKGQLYEQVLMPDGYSFVNFNGKSYEYHKELVEINVSDEEIKYTPCRDEEIIKGMVRITSGPIDYVNLKTLLKEIDEPKVKP